MMKPGGAILFIFNSPLSSGCDYVMQTIRIVSRKFPVYGLALGDIISFRQWLTSRNRWTIKIVSGAVIIRPIAFLPGIRFRLIRQIIYCSYAVALRLYFFFAFFGRIKYVWFFEPFHIPPLLSLFFGYTSLYDCVDYFPGFNIHAKRDHDKVMDASSFVFANSIGLATKLRRIRSDVEVVPLGFDDVLFRRMKIVPVRRGKTSFVVGYIGSISDRMDFPLLTETIRRLPGIRFLFVGPEEHNVFGSPDRATRHMQALLRYQNVRWIPGVPKKEIPSFLRKIDVGYIPYRTDRTFNRLSFPMKVMEYFAGGRPVVSTQIQALESYRKKGLVFVAETPTQMVRDILFLKRHGWSSKMQRQQRSVARMHRWEHKVGAILRRATAYRSD